MDTVYFRLRASLENRELKQTRFLAMQVNWKWDLLSFSMPWR